ncbi:MAG: protein-glutamate O-methyltransferase CheR [Burkholderiaceae bacterium]|nr:protein-glutamate O-methyltransferase CheR [Burkholderiaceae bacterium]
MPSITIGLEDFLKFKEFFYRKTGILFEETKRYFVDKRLIERIEANNLGSFREYFTMLRFQASGKEFQTLTNLMTVNETYFFREAYQFDCLVNSLLNEVVKNKARGDTIKIWSIPSSSGEEPYSIAIYLLEKWAKIDDYEVEILSSDIDTEILQAAQKGIYSSHSVRNLPSNYLLKYFENTKPGFWQINKDLRESVEFSRINLMNTAETRKFRNIDVVFCRNLLIYFDDISRRMAAETFFDALNPGGFMCLGHSETMSRISNLFSLRKFPESMVYQKPLKG